MSGKVDANNPQVTEYIPTSQVISQRVSEEDSDVNNFIELTDHSFIPCRDRRKYSRSTIIKDGILEKWTNYLGAWRSRYFILEPGILKYANSPGQPIKETYPLSLCTSRFCTKDNMCLELEHPQGILYLKLPNATEKKSWVEAFLEAKNAFLRASCEARCLPGLNLMDESIQAPLKQETSTTISIDGLSSSVIVSSKDNLADFQSETQYLLDEGKPPMVLLLEHIKSCSRSLESVSSELKRAQSTFLQLATEIKDTQFRQTGNVAISQLLEALDHLNVVTHRFLQASKTLALDERYQRRTLENSITILARDYYEMNLKLNLIQEKLLPSKKVHLTITKIMKYLEHFNPQLVRRFSSTTSLHSYTELSPLSCNEESNAFVSHNQNFSSESIETLIFHLSSTVPFLIILKNLNDIFDGQSQYANEEKEDDLEFFDIDDSCSEGFTLNDETKSKSYDEAVIQPEKKNTLSKDKELFSSDASPVIQRRTKLPKPRTKFNIRLWTVIKDFIGRDLSRIVLPIYFNEPTSFVQRLAEDFRYASLLEKASLCKNSLETFRWVAAFSITPCASTIGRTYKPFNPLLGETYEMTHRGFKFFAEQVSHHPPITAYSVQGQRFDAWGHLMVKTRFSGKSIEISLFGPSHIACLGDKTNIHQEKLRYTNHFTLQRCKGSVNNVIFGKLTLEMCDTVLLTNHTTGDCCIIEYLSSSWWTNREPCVVRGVIFDNMGVARFKLGGRWNYHLWSEALVCSGTESYKIQPATLANLSTISSDLREHNKDILIRSERGVLCEPNYCSRNIMEIKVCWDALVSQPGTREVLWQYEQPGSDASMYYEFSQYTMELNELSSDYDPSFGIPMPPTDSRFRMDQRYLEEGLVEMASMEKEKLEKAQRERACLNNIMAAPHCPRWFKLFFDPFTMHDTWLATGEYWKAKEKNCFTDCINLFR